MTGSAKDVLATLTGSSLTFVRGADTRGFRQQKKDGNLTVNRKEKQMISLLKFVVNAQFLIGFLLGGLGAFVYLFFKPVKKG